MSNYLTAFSATLTLAALAGSTACARDEAPAARPVVTAQAAASPAAAPAAAVPASAAQPPATAAAPANGVKHYVQAPSVSSLDFTFTQAGAANRGKFGKFATQLDYDAQNLAASALHVTVQIASIDTQDEDRNTLLAGPELFDAKTHPTASYAASSLGKRANGGLEAIGKLTLRGVTKDLRLPLTLTQTASGYDLSGKVTIKRLDFGVGQGEWQATDSVANEVDVSYKVVLVPAPPR